jgi:RNA polymerase sigma-70 factor (ECF subfamily)
VDRTEEAQLVNRAAAGEREAFGRLVANYWPGIFRWLLACTAESAVAEDLTQEVFLKAWAKLRDGQFVCDHFRAWLYRIAANALTDWRRRCRIQHHHAQQLVPPATEAEPSASLAARELRQHLWQAVGELPLTYRMPLLLRAQEQLSFREIAERLGITEETARWRVFRARSWLLRKLGPLLDEGNVSAEMGCDPASKNDRLARKGRENQTGD